MKTYHGTNEGVGGQSITVTDGDKTYPLPHILRHSPDGFQWGYGGSGPADTALSILTDCIGEEEANKFHQGFKFDFIAPAEKELKIKEEDIRAWLKEAKERMDIA